MVNIDKEAVALLRRILDKDSTITKGISDEELKNRFKNKAIYARAKLAVAIKHLRNEMIKAFSPASEIIRRCLDKICSFFGK